MNANGSKHHISSLMALMLFGIFAICILAVLLGATGVYQRLTERDARSYENRTAVMYLATKVRQNDCADRIATGTLGGSDALVLTETVEGETFETWIYCHDGYLYELFLPAALEPSPEDGEQLLPVEELQLELTDGLLSVTLTQNGTRQTLRLGLRSGEVQP